MAKAADRPSGKNFDIQRAAEEATERLDLLEKSPARLEHAERNLPAPDITSITLEMTPPIAYLTRWRTMLAVEELTRGRAPMTQIAQACGYDSENAFNTAFKRVLGRSPRRYVLAELDRKASADRAARGSNNPSFG